MTRALARLMQVAMLLLPPATCLAQTDPAPTAAARSPAGSQRRGARMASATATSRASVASVKTRAAARRAPVQALGPTIAVARLWSDDGRKEEARNLLEESQRGFDTTLPVPLLSEAATLLAAL